jgi:hypothetical protein
MSTDDTFARWRDNLDYAYENHPGGPHPYRARPRERRAHAIMLLDRFIVHIKQHDDVVRHLSDIYDRWSDD